ncbi:AraC-like DNA-binding protein [Azospirillum fermentarium]|uniref:helix-turn-helix domain-containing protein n=1 Tax=Azospirillum fermentarium TaxID=1233114 RepID=UPI00222607C1|nr:helix-turn-helix domain-containing protein [Azospirillum fermentarium]MCW2248865.1 AraC-like DNA-binding protein [Azospirillum fermentarium]
MPPIPAPTARLLLPRPALSACVFAGVERDTRGTALTDAQRFNHYPASPMAVISWIFHGTLHMVEQGTAAPVLGPPLPPLILSGPQNRPTASWSPGPVHALSVGFCPEALPRLAGIGVESVMDRHTALDTAVSGPLLDACRAVLENGDADPFTTLQDRLAPLWSGPEGEARRVPRLGDWVRALTVRAALSPAGRSVRQVQRRIRGWTGQSHRGLQRFTQVEDVGVRVWSHHGPSPPDLAGLADDAGFADQSHMGRAVRRVTGLPPGRLEALMRTDESFWFYRLMGEQWEE